MWIQRPGGSQTGDDVTVWYSDPVFLAVVHRHFCSIGDGFRAIFENVNSAARWRPRPEMTSPFNCWPRFLVLHWHFTSISIHSKLNTTFWFWLGSSVSGNFRENCSPGLKFLTWFNFVCCCNCRAASICLFELVVSLKCYRIEYFGWEALSGEFFIMKLPQK
jgi:hypothetical protein